MKTRRTIPMWVSLFWLVAVPAAMAQTGNLYGVLYRQNPAGPNPMPLSNHEVLLYSRSTGWIGPSLTDGYGKYALYNVPRGRYLLRINFRGSQVWQQEVEVPAAVPPIVLPALRSPRAPAPPK